MTNITGSYEDLYIFETGRWVIKQAQFRMNSMKTFDVSNGINLKKVN